MGVVVKVIYNRMHFFIYKSVVIIGRLCASVFGNVMRSG